MQGISIKPGVLVLVGNKQFEIIDSVSSSKIRVRDLTSGEVTMISPGEIDFELKRTALLSNPDSGQSERTSLIESASEADIKLASDRYDVLLPVAGRRPISKNEMTQCAVALNLSESQVNRLLNRLDTNIGPLSLLPQRRGRVKGIKLIDASAEDAIQEIIEEFYTGPGITYQVIIDKVLDRCSSKSIPPPSAATIASRLRAVNPRALLAKKSGSKAASQEFEVRGGKVLPEEPLELIQIDHAEVDCIIVDSEQRQSLMRPWVTVAIDVYTRVILGFYLSLWYPSSMSVALCISHAILPKDRWLRLIGMPDGEYPFYGVPKRIHVDNAKEFRSKNLEDSCRKYGIKLTWRPKKIPHNGAHIERYNRTLMTRVHLLPGTTMSSTKNKGQYKSERHAAMSFSELREWITREIEIYHKDTHSDLGCSPLHMWEKFFQKKDGGFSYPPIVDDQKRLLIDFMPVKSRVLGREGIKLHNIVYYSPTLKCFNIRTRCTVRYDPEAISKIWVLPEGEKHYIEIGYSDLRLPNTSLIEFKRTRAKLRADSKRRVPASEVFKLIKKNDALVNSAVATTKEMRKMREQKKTRLTDPGHPLNEKNSQKVEISTSTSPDYSVQPRPYDIEE
ncbi:MAG: Mu transposase C-terminal domain-containing protein [Pseudomonas sp.]|uniref:Mu transposase C-terminal domain-containing protein n=1 Tax=Pseudomonas sp. TaxID=306 RepID=UPI003D6DBC11